MQTLSAPAHLFHRRAMNTLFEFALCGDDEEHLAAVAEAGLDEVVRVERLLSRFDPTSEISRLNRDAGAGPVLVDRELLDILLMCREYWQRTDGFFDLTSGSPGSFSAVEINPAGRTVRFTAPEIRLDLGALGKGYALDRAAALTLQYGFEQALLHGGTSSVLALGEWPVGVRDPWNPAGELTQFRLSDSGMSSSAAFGAEQQVSDIIHPHQRQPLREQAGCTVVAPTAAEAEILSTALLAMSEEQATKYCQRPDMAGRQVGWMKQDTNQTVLRWLTNNS